MCNSLHELMASAFSAQPVLIFTLCLAVVSTVSWALALEDSKQHVLCQNEDDARLCRCVMYFQVLAEAPHRPLLQFDLVHINVIILNGWLACLFGYACAGEHCSCLFDKHLMLADAKHSYSRQLES